MYIQISEWRQLEWVSELFLGETWLESGGGWCIVSVLCSGGITKVAISGTRGATHAVRVRRLASTFCSTSTILQPWGEGNKHSHVCVNKDWRQCRDRYYYTYGRSTHVHVHVMVNPSGATPCWWQQDTTAQCLGTTHCTVCCEQLQKNGLTRVVCSVHSVHGMCGCLLSAVSGVIVATAGHPLCCCTSLLWPRPHHRHCNIIKRDEWHTCTNVGQRDSKTTSNVHVALALAFPLCACVEKKLWAQISRAVYTYTWL